jgi:isocitrate dehydrogenase kinase/phosphatase
MKKTTENLTVLAENVEWKVAKQIYDSWDVLINNFLDLTSHGKEYFEDKRYKEMFGLAVQRYNLYGVMASETYTIIESLLGDKLFDIGSWEKIKHYYAQLIHNRYDKPNTETFYNSISRKVFNQVSVGFTERFEFFNNEDYHVVDFT